MTNQSDFGEVFRRADEAAWRASQSDAFVPDQETALLGLRAQYATLFETVDRSNRNAVGTPVQEVFSESDAKLAVSFIDFMQQRGFPAIDTLRWDPNYPADYSDPLDLFLGRKPAWKVRGYKIGYAEVPKDSSDVFVTSTIKRASSSPAIFLCEDYRLRAGDSPNKHFNSSPRERATLYGNFPLFVDADGSVRYKTIVYPEISTVTYTRVWQDATPGRREPDVDSGRNYPWVDIPGTPAGWYWYPNVTVNPGNLEYSLTKLAEECFKIRGGS